MFHLRKDSVSYILAHPKITLSPTLGAKNVTQYYMLTLCLRYTEVDQTFGWARLAMGLKYIPCHWVGVIAQGMVK